MKRIKRITGFRIDQQQIRHQNMNETANTIRLGEDQICDGRLFHALYVPTSTWVFDHVLTSAIQNTETPMYVWEIHDTRVCLFGYLMFGSKRSRFQPIQSSRSPLHVCHRLIRYQGDPQSVNTRPLKRSRAHLVTYPGIQYGITSSDL